MVGSVRGASVREKNITSLAALKEGCHNLLKHKSRDLGRGMSAEDFSFKGNLVNRFLTTVRAEIITELIPRRAGPVIFQTFLLELIAFRPIPVICPAR